MSLKSTKLLKDPATEHICSETGKVIPVNELHVLDTDDNTRYCKTTGMYRTMCEYTSALGLLGKLR